jgi:rod shape-determining protein MreC
MDTFMGRYRNVSILAAAIFLQVVGLAVQIKRRTEDDSSRLIRVWTVSMIAPFEKAIVRMQSSSSGIWHNYFYLRGVRQQNRDLQQQIQQMQLEQVRLRQDAEQARRLQTLLGFKEQFINKTIAAQVIGSSGSEQSRLVYIDKGSDDGIKTDMAVMTASGVVGKVSNVINGSTSQVLLINDQNSGVGTILEQSRLQGVLKGKASGELALDKIMAEEEVKLGDHVLTSGGDLIFPKGLPVGTVDKINRGKEFVQVIVKPAAALNHLEEVLVITQKLEREPAVASGTSVRAADILAERLPSVPDTPPNPHKVASESDGAVAAKPAVKPQSEAAASPSAASQNTVSIDHKPQASQTAPQQNATVTSAPKPSQPVIQQNASAENAAKPKPSTAPSALQNAPLNPPAQAATHLVPTSVGIKPPASGAISKPAAPGTAAATVPKSATGTVSNPATTAAPGTTAASGKSTTSSAPKTIAPPNGVALGAAGVPKVAPSKPAAGAPSKPAGTTTSAQPNAAGDATR